jgi:hypothetical protein
MTNIALRVYTAVVALVCGGAVAYSIDQQRVAAAASADARSWQAAVQRSVHHDRATLRTNRLMVRRYNVLVRRTKRSERRLLAALATARSQAAAPAYAAQATVYRTVSTPAAPTAAPVPVSAPTPVPVSSPPTTKTS